MFVRARTPGQNLKNSEAIARICTAGPNEGRASIGKKNPQQFNWNSSSSADQKLKTTAQKPLNPLQ